MNMNKINEKSKYSDKIWRIINKIQTLEDTKDNLIEYLNTKSNLDDNKRSFCMGLVQ